MKELRTVLSKMFRSSCDWHCLYNNRKRKECFLDRTACIHYFHYELHVSDIPPWQCSQSGRASNINHRAECNGKTTW